MTKCKTRDATASKKEGGVEGADLSLNLELIPPTTRDSSNGPLVPE